MSRLALGLMLVAAPAVAQEPPMRAGQPPMAADGGERPGMPAMLAAPLAQAGAAELGAQRFGAAYARAARPRIVLFWNRELTDDVASDREEVTTLSADSGTSASGWRRDRAGRWGGRTDAGMESSSRTDAEMRVGTRRIDAGRHAAAHDEAEDFDMERGFADALAGAGARLVDRTAILRQGALGADTGNVQAIETRAILGRAEWTLEVVAMDDPRRAAGTSWRIVARNVADGRIVARATSTGQPAARAMPWVAGERGFVRATPRAPSAYERGRQIALDAMVAIAGRL